MKPLYIASCSFGKDSIATILLALEHNEPLDRIFYVEIMYDNSRGISAEHPEHRDFIYNTAIPYFQNQGVQVDVKQTDNDYMSLFNKRRIKGKNVGKKYGFPLIGACHMNSQCKMKAINQYNAEIKKEGYDAIHYVGIAIDEPVRLARCDGVKEISLMGKYQVTEAQAEEMCKEKGLYSPLYQFSKRGGCWFCPNARPSELRHVYDTHPELLYELVELEKDPEIISHYYHNLRKEHMSDIIERFYWEDQQMSIFDFIESEDNKDETKNADIGHADGSIHDNSRSGSDNKRFGRTDSPEDSPC